MFVGEWVRALSPSIAAAVDVEEADVQPPATTPIAIPVVRVATRTPPLSSPEALHAVLLGCNGRAASISVANRAIEWLLLGSTDAELAEAAQRSAVIAGASAAKPGAAALHASTSVAGIESSELVVVVGLDTEALPHQLVQLAVRGRCLLIHRASGCFSALAQLLENRWPPFNAPNGKMVQVRCVFAGAELADDAMGLISSVVHTAGAGGGTGPGDGLGARLHGGLDLTPLYGTRNSPHGLAKMLNDCFKSTWRKDKAISTSDWSATPLTLAQLKYGVLDAWASEMVGLHACIVPGPVHLPGAQGGDAGQMPTARLRLFTTASLSVELARTLTRIREQGQTIANAGKAWFEVRVGSDKEDAGLQNRAVTRIAMESYNKRLRRGAPVEAMLTTGTWAEHGIRDAHFLPLSDHTSGTRGGAIAKQVLRGEVFKVDGSMAMADWSSTIANETSTGLLVPGNDAANAVTRAFKEKKLKLMSNNFKEKDSPTLDAVRTALDIVRKHHLRSWSVAEHSVAAESQSAIVADAGASDWIASSNLLTALHLLMSQPSSSNARTKKFIFDNRHTFRQADGTSVSLPVLAQACEENCTRLNDSQWEAVRCALSCRVSAIRGPPGTGKTSTLAALSGSIANAGGRVLILAPANSATLRVLESIVEAGNTDVALLVSKEFCLDWHQESYHAHLRPFVVTQEVVDRKQQKRLREVGAYARAHDGVNHASGDLHDRPKVVPRSKWDHIFGKRKQKTTPPATTTSQSTAGPRIVIQTYGSLISVGEGPKAVSGDKATCVETRKAASWSDSIMRAVDWSSISTVIVDETSQLWEGHALALLRRAPSTANVVLVGDDRQLPPFGSDDEKTGGRNDKKSASASIPDNQKLQAASLFDCAIAGGIDIPTTQLDTSYRLPEEITSILSPALYGGNLSTERNDKRDETVRKRLKQGMDLMTSNSSTKVSD